MQANKHVIDLCVSGLNAKMFEQKIWRGQGAPITSTAVQLFSS